MAFAKLYGEGDGQILVKVDSGENGDPEVRFYFQPEDLGVCSFSMHFEDSDDGRDAAEAAFGRVTHESARELINKQFGPGAW